MEELRHAASLIVPDVVLLIYELIPLAHVTPHPLTPFYSTFGSWQEGRAPRAALSASKSPYVTDPTPTFEEVEQG